MSGDALHKLGTGTLKIDGSGINGGSLNTGDGAVILAQRPDGEGKFRLLVGYLLLVVALL